jgi:hypothetical protein
MKIASFLNVDFVVYIPHKMSENVHPPPPHQVEGVLSYQSCIIRYSLI